MDKQRMSNILSSVQMSPRDRKDFIDELSKLGKGGTGGGEVSTEHPVRIIELTPEELITGKELDIAYEEYINSTVIFLIKDDIYLTLNKICNGFKLEGRDLRIFDVYKNCIVGQATNVTYIYVEKTSDNKLIITPASVFSVYDDINFYLNTNGVYINLDIIRLLELDKTYTAKLIFPNNSNIIGSYYNGTFTAFADGKIQIYDVNSETGAITLSKSINPELIGTVAKLEVGDADDVCQRNLEIINMAIAQVNANHFDVDIDYGVGSATFTQGLADDAIAGTATIIVATGYVTKYNLYGNGKVEKVGNDIDLFALEARIAALEGA